MKDEAIIHPTYRMTFLRQGRFFRFSMWANRSHVVAIAGLALCLMKDTQVLRSELFYGEGAQS